MCQRAEFGARPIETANFSQSRFGAGTCPSKGTFELGKEKIMKKFLKLLKDKSGASAAEYALILAIVGAAIAVASVTLGDAIGNAMTNTAGCIQDTATCPTS